MSRVNSLDDLLREGWETHDRDAAGVAARLEEHAMLVSDGDGAAKFSALVLHAVGQELSDWPRAVRLCVEAVTRAGATAGPSALTPLAVARFLAGDTPGALATEAEAVSLDSRNSVAILARIRALAAEALVGRGDWEAGLALFRAALDLGGCLAGASPADRTLAVVANNVTSAFLEWPGRTPAHGDLLRRGARAARSFWLRAGDWTNDERSDYLLAMVENALGSFGEALPCADRALATIAKNGSEPVDAAFLHVERARALRGLGRGEDAARAWAEAEALGHGFEDAGLREELAKELRASA